MDSLPILVNGLSLFAFIHRNGAESNPTSAKLSELYPSLSYIHLTFYKDILDHTVDEIISAVKEGINIYSNTISPEALETIWPMLNVHLQYAESQLPDNAKWIFFYIMEKITGIKKEQHQSDVAQLERLFTTDISAFTDEFESEPGETSKYIMTPILKDISEKCITDKVQKSEPKDVISLTNFVNSRFGNSFPELQEEIIFLTRIEKALSELKPTEIQASDIYIEKIVAGSP